MFEFYVFLIDAKSLDWEKQLLVYGTETVGSEGEEIYDN